MNSTTTSRLMRSRTDKMIAGVAGGIANYLAIDPVIVRLVFVALVFSGIGILLYPALWLIMPLEGNVNSVPNSGTPRQQRYDPLTGQPINSEEEIPIRNIAPATSAEAQQRRSRVLGLVLLGLGTFLLLKILLPGGFFAFVVPVLLIGGGILLLQRTA